MPLKRVLKKIEPMIYAIIGILFVVALFLIFRNDHDSSYNRNEKKAQRQSEGARRQSAYSKKESPRPELKSEPKTEPFRADEPKAEKTDLSFLDTLDYSEDLEENTETFDIAGLQFHCSLYDCGRIVGYVKPEPSNVHDARAQAVIRADGKRLGYIPRTQLDWYEDFNELNVICPFVGEIELDRSSARLIAEIKVIIPVSREFVQEEIEADGEPS